MASRTPIRLASSALALLRWGIARRRPAAPQRILVLHHLLLGDTLCVTALLAKLRANHPQAEIVMTVPRAFADLYASRPYGVRAHPFDPRDFATFRALLGAPRFDLAILPADNRWSWLARALGVRWIVGLADDRPRHKNWPVDELVPYSRLPTAFADTAAELEPGLPPLPYDVLMWPAPPACDAPVIAGRYALLHVGASTPLKLWPAERWRGVADWLSARGCTVAWSCGPGEESLVASVQPRPDESVHAGTLSLPGLWHLVAGAALLVAPDTGVAHLGRVTGVPTVTLFGPGSATICGAGRFFAAMPGRVVTVEPFPCRDQTVQFFRTVPWARRCERLYGPPPSRCPRARCMEAIDVRQVIAAIVDLVGEDSR